MNRTTGILIVIILLSIGFNIALWLGNASNPIPTSTTSVVENVSNNALPQVDSPPLSKDQELEKSEESPQNLNICLLYTSPSPRDQRGSRMPSSA